MKSFVAVLALVAVAVADVSHLVKKSESDATIVSQASDVAADGFGFGYETSNGISGQANGVLKTFGNGEAALAFEGFNAYTAPNGQVIQLVYVADENGYRPKGDHLPTPPPPQPIPEYIERALAYIAAHPQPEQKLRA